MQSFSGGAPRVGVGALLVVLALSAHARADQFIVADVTYTHSNDTTSDSHYRVAPSAATPKDWTKPFDWTKGSVHVLLEVKTKPTDTPTQFQICFEGTPSYACTYQLAEPYTKPNTYQSSTPFSGMWSPKDKPMSWANGVTKVALILKDIDNGKPQGDPKYVPTDLHVEVAVVSEGAEYQPPSAPPKDAGVADAGGKDASAKDARVEGPTDAGEIEPPTDGGRSTPMDDAAVSAPRRDGSTSTPVDASARGDEDLGEVSNSIRGDSGCAVGGGWERGWLVLLVLAVLPRRRTARANARASEPK